MDQNGFFYEWLDFFHKSLKLYDCFYSTETTNVIWLPLENSSVKKISIHLEHVYMR